MNFLDLNNNGGLKQKNTSHIVTFYVVLRPMYMTKFLQVKMF